MCTDTCRHCSMPIIRPDSTNPWRAPSSQMPLICGARAGVSLSAAHEPGRDLRLRVAIPLG